jgi:hypothetical protein
MLEDAQALAAAWCSPVAAAAAAAGSGSVQQLTAVKHLLQPLINAVVSQHAESAAAAAAAAAAANPSSSSSSATASHQQQQQYSRNLSGRQLASLAESALVGMLTSAEQQWLRWLLGQCLAVAASLLQQQGLPVSQQVVVQVLEFVTWAQQQQQGEVEEKQQQQQQQQQRLQEPLVLLKQQVAAAAEQQVQQLLQPWHGPAVATANPPAAAAAVVGGSSSSSSLPGSGAPNGGLTKVEMQSLVSACQRLAAAMNAAHNQTAADVARFTGIPLQKQLFSAAAGGSAVLELTGSGFQRRAATHAAVPAGQTTAAAAAGRVGSGGTLLPHCASESSSSSRAGSFGSIPWESTYWPIALTAAAARYNVIQAALADVFAAGPGRSTATLAAVMKLLQPPLLLLELQLQGLGFWLEELPGDALQLDEQQQQQQKEAVVGGSQAGLTASQQQQKQLATAGSVSAMWKSVLSSRSSSFNRSSGSLSAVSSHLPVNSSSSSSSSGAAGTTAHSVSCTGSFSEVPASVGIAAVVSGNWSVAVYRSQQQQRLQLHQPFVTHADSASATGDCYSGQHSRNLPHPQQRQQRQGSLESFSRQSSSGATRSRSGSFTSLLSAALPHQLQQQHVTLPQPRLRAAAAEFLIELFPWPDMLLLQQQLWISCCAAEVATVLQQQLAVEERVPYSNVLPVAGSAAQLYRMLQAAMGAWAEVLLHVAPAGVQHGDSCTARGDGNAALQQQHVDVQRQQQEQHRFQRRRQHGSSSETGKSQQQQQQQHVQVSARSAAMCRLMLGAVRRLQQQYLTHLLGCWDACCSRSTAAAAAAGSGGLLLSQQLGVMLNSLLLMRQEAEQLEGALHKVGLWFVHVAMFWFVCLQFCVIPTVSSHHPICRLEACCVCLLLLVLPAACCCCCCSSCYVTQTATTTSSTLLQQQQGLLLCQLAVTMLTQQQLGWLQIVTHQLLEQSCPGGTASQCVVQQHHSSSSRG